MTTINETTDMARPTRIDDLMRSREKILADLRQAFGLISNCQDELSKFYDYGLFDHNPKVPSKYNNIESCMASVTKRVDSAGWRHLMDACGLASLMDQATKQKFDAQIMDEPQPLTMDNAIATFEALREQQTSIMAQGVINVFRSLNYGLYKSNSAFKLDPDGRVITSGAAEPGYFGVQPSYNGTDKIADLYRVFLLLDKKTIPQNLHAAVREFMRDQDAPERRNSRYRYLSDSECDYFRVKLFKNGNAHIWFKRPDLVERINRVIAHHYGTTLPDDRNRKAAA